MGGGILHKGWREVLGILLKNGGENPWEKKPIFPHFLHLLVNDKSANNNPNPISDNAKHVFFYWQIWIPSNFLLFPRHPLTLFPLHSRHFRSVHTTFSTDFMHFFFQNFIVHYNLHLLFQSIQSNSLPHHSFIRIFLSIFNLLLNFVQINIFY